MRVLLVLSLLFLTINAHAAQTCSRIAVINYQEVLVDSNSSEKGEGLRFHLEKDPVAKEYLDKYQKGTRSRWHNAVLGTAGTGLLLAGVFNSDSDSRKILLISGASTLLVNFLLSRTIEMNNESNLNHAIEEYNKRNLPKIYFNPEETRSQLDLTNYRVGIMKQWTF